MLSLRAAILTLAVLLCSCQTNFYLMPTPVVLSTGIIDAYANSQDANQDNSLYVFYATNRQALGLKSDRKYIVGLTDKMHLGQARVRIGAKEMPWDVLRSESSVAKRDKKIGLHLEQAEELAIINSHESIIRLNKNTQRFIDAVNETLAETESKDITVYVHGATVNFFHAMAQAAQIQHFTGRNHIVLVLAWPTAENFLRYDVDVQNSAKTVPVFRRLLQFLANHTTADYINVLAYSAGAQVASPGLYKLGMGYDSKPGSAAGQGRKLGEVYYAAPDIDLLTFVQQLPAYKKIARNVTLALNVNDFVLRMAQRHHGVSRAGLPDASELSVEETKWIVAASRNGQFDLIDVSSAEMPSFGSRSHDFWYTHPWVSSDVLVQLLYHVGPKERGLLPIETDDGSVVWSYPSDYPEKIVNAVILLNSKIQP